MDPPAAQHAHLVKQGHQACLDQTPPISKSVNPPAGLLSRFVHVSDLHLGAKQYWNGDLAEDHLTRLEDIFSIALRYHADFILMGGDIFTSQDLLPGLFLKIIGVFERFQAQSNRAIPIIAIEGNHDIRRYSHGNELPQPGSWVRVLERMGFLRLLAVDPGLRFQRNPRLDPHEFRERGCIQIKNARIFGTQYLGQNPADLIHQVAEALPPRDRYFQILIQHWGIKGQMKNVPGVALADAHALRPKVDYLALGHYHLGYHLDNWIYNPGCPEPVSPGEANFQRGAFLVEFWNQEGGSFAHRVKRLRFPSREIQWKKVFFKKQANTQSEVAEALVQALEKAPGGHLSPQIHNSSGSEKKPLWCVQLSGVAPKKAATVDENALRELVKRQFSAVDVKFYQKFNSATSVLDGYF